MLMYDIIGDIHGHGEELVDLLQKLGYELNNGCYAHPEERKAVFLGDFIDRGPKHRLVLDTVKPMVEQGAALSIMGNHEFNAICFDTPDPSDPSKYLRPHIQKNIGQHVEFLKAYQDQGERDAVIEWFKTLPLWLDLGGLRAIHACWHEPSMSIIQGLVNEDNTLTEKGFIESSRKGSDAYHAIETLLKGVEAPLPEGEKFHDKDGHSRYEIRTQWWDKNADTYVKASLPQGIVDHLAKQKVPSEARPGYSEDAPPLFIGHYWFSGEPKPLLHNLACLDYSVAKGGSLVAYRWDGGKELSKYNFRSV